MASSFDIFLSHSVKDKAAAEMLRGNIERWQFRCFCDHASIEAGENWEQSILEALRRSYALVVYVTPNAMESKWVFAEIQIARYAGKPILLVRTDHDAKIPTHLGTIQCIDASTGSTGGTFLEELKSALERIRANRPDERPPSNRPLPLPEQPPSASRPRDLARESRQLAKRVLELLEPKRRQPEGDAERGLLLALAAVEEYTWTPEAERALLTGLLVSKLTGRLRHDQAGLLDAHLSGSRVVMVGGGTASVWQLPECKQVRLFAGRITAARLSADGLTLFTGDHSGHLKRLPIDGASPGSRLSVFENPIVQLAVLPNGSVCVVAKRGQCVFVRPSWEAGPSIIGIVEDVAPAVSGHGLVALAHDDASITLHGADGILRHTLRGHDKAVTSLAFSADGQLLATGAEDGRFFLWATDMGTAMVALEPSQVPIRQVSMSPDGHFVAVTSADRSVRIWDRAGALICVLPRGTLEFEHAWMIANDQLATACADHSAQLWTQHGALLQRLVGHNGPILNVMHCPEQNWLLTASSDGTVLAWSIHPGAERLCLQHNGFSVERCTFAPREGNPITTGADGLLYVWDEAGKQLQRCREHSKAISLLVATPPGEILTAAPGEAIRLWKLGQSSPLKRFGQAGSVQSAALSPRGDYVAWANADGVISLAPTSHPESIRELAGHGAKVVSLVFSSDGKRLLSASEDGSALVWVTANGGSPLRLQPSGYALAQACFDANDLKVMTLSREAGPAWIWDAQSGRKLFALRDHEEVITDAAFCPNGRWIATASRDKTVRLWSADNGECHAMPLVHDDVPVRLRFCYDGSRLVTACRDGVALVWDPDAGTLLCRLSGHTCGLTDVVFSPDGEEVMTASFDGTARIYSVPRRERLVELAKKRVFRQLTEDERREHGLR